MPDVSFASSSLCVAGNVNRDIKTAPFAPGSHLFQDGENSVHDITETIGGGGANSACMAAGLGARVTLLGKLGRDRLGAQLELALQKHGVITRLTFAPGCRTGSSIALAFENGQRHFISSLPNNTSLVWQDLQVAAIDSHKHLLRADIWFSEAMLFEGNRLLFNYARQKGVEVSIDLNWDPQWGVASAAQIAARKQAVRDVLPLVTLAHGNVRELNEFSDSADLHTTLERLTKWGAQAVVVHKGAEGAGYFSQDKFWQEPPALARCRGNATGTGDLLSVCLILLRQQALVSIQDQLRIANETVRDFIEGKLNLLPEL